MESSIATPKSTPVQFNGAGGEFFRIWIVNVALTIITLGIYSAWAKVRTQRYFYGNTRIADHAFEYLATGGQILKGRLIAVVAFIVFQILTSLSVVLALAGLLAFVAAMPWLMNAGLRFNARVSTWRNVRFNFTGSYGGALMAFFVWPMIGSITLGILMPKAVHRSAEYIVKNHSYGEESFAFDATVADYKSTIYGLMIAYVVTLLLLVVSAMQGLWALYVIAFLAIYALAFCVKPLLFNIYWRHVKLKDNGFDAQMSVGRFAWIFISNSLVVGLTLGLMYPWAKVRMARFTAESLTFNDAGNIDTIVGTQAARSNALGEELGEVFDVDLGFGV